LKSDYEYTPDKSGAEESKSSWMKTPEKNEEREDQQMKCPTNETSSLYKSQLVELKRILHFISCHPIAAGYF